MGSYACDARQESTHWQDHTEDDAMFAFAGMQIGGVPTCYTEDRTTYADCDWNLRVIQSEASCTNEEEIKFNKRRLHGQKNFKKKGKKKLLILAEKLQDARRANSRLAISDVSLEIKKETNDLNNVNRDIEKLTASNNILQTLPKKGRYNSREVLRLVKASESPQVTHHK